MQPYHEIDENWDPIRPDSTDTNRTTLWSWIWKRAEIPVQIDVKMDIVIAHYTESLSEWSTMPWHMIRRVFIYHKGLKKTVAETNWMSSAVPSTVPVIWTVLPNVGRESHTILTHCLAVKTGTVDVPYPNDHVLFVQGSCLDHVASGHVLPISQWSTYLQGPYITATRQLFPPDCGRIVHLEPWLRNWKSGKMQRAKTGFDRFYEYMLQRDLPVSPFWISMTNHFSVVYRRIVEHGRAVYDRLLNSLAHHTDPETGHYFERLCRPLFGGIDPPTDSDPIPLVVTRTVPINTVERLSRMPFDEVFVPVVE